MCTISKRILTRMLYKEIIVKIYAPKTAANSILEYCEHDPDGPVVGDLIVAAAIVIYRQFIEAPPGAGIRPVIVIALPLGELRPFGPVGVHRPGAVRDNNLILFHDALLYQPR